MNKQFKFFLTSAAIAAALVGAVSCQKDLSGDLDKLDNEVKGLKEQLTELQTSITNGEVIKNITTTADGVTIVTNKGEYTVKNGTNGTNGSNGTNGTNGKDGKDGKDGSVVEIGSNGNWFIDKKDTGVPAKGTNGTNGKDGLNPDYYVPNGTTGKFDKYTYNATSGKYESSDSGISFLAPGTVTAVWENETLTLYGVKGFEGGYVLNLLTNLKGLAFVPERIFDGLGLITVTEIWATENNKAFPFVNPKGKAKFIQTAPTEVTYRMDAANVDVTKYKWSFINRKVYTKVAADDKNDLIKILNEDELPVKTNSFVTFNIRLNKTVKEAAHAQENDIVALRAYDADKEPVVSDYAYIENVANTGYALVHKDGYKKGDPRYYRVLPEDVLIDDPTEYNAAEDGSGQGINVTDAGVLGGNLKNPATPVLILGEKETIDLEEYVETYAKELKDVLTAFGVKPVYKFAFAGFDEDNKIVMDLNNPTDPTKAEYLSDDADVTNQNDFVVLDGSTVTINPKYAKDKAARPALGRTPLIYVRSFLGSYVLAEGFIKLEIREDAEEVPSDDNYKIFIRHSAEFDYDDIPAAGTYGEEKIGKDFVAPNEKYNYAADDFEKVRELNVGWEEMNLKVFKELEMSFEEFQNNYNVDDPVLIVAKVDNKLVQPGDLPLDEAKYDDEALKAAKLVARDEFPGIADRKIYYGEGLTVNALSPANWKQNTNIVSLILDPAIEISGPHFVYVVYKANSAKNPDVVVKFVYNVKHDHEYTIAKWLLNPDYILGDQNELNPVDPKPYYNKSAAPYNKTDKGWGAVRIKGQVDEMQSGLTEHFIEYMKPFIEQDEDGNYAAINPESLYKFEIKNYATKDVDWKVVANGGTYGTTTYEDNTIHAFVELTGEELIAVINDPTLVPYIYLQTDEPLIAKGYDVLVEVTESCEKFAEDEDYEPVYGYYFVVFQALKAEIRLYNVKLGTFKDYNDYAYAHELVEGIYDEYGDKIFEWDSEAGTWVATDAAEAYGINDDNTAELLSVEVKSVLKYPWDTEDSFGGNLFAFPAGFELTPAPASTVETGINWWNLGTDLQVDKKAVFTIQVLWGEAPAEPAEGEEEEEEEVEDTRDILCEADGTVIVLSTANTNAYATHPLHDLEGAIWEPVVYDIEEDEYKPVFKAVKELPEEEEEDGE